MNENINLYLGYLEKEMTIMGILSGFCVAALAGVIDRVIFSPGESAAYLFWSTNKYYVATSSFYLLLSALSFYLQRSLLAWYFGQITLALNLTPNKVKEWLKDADSWNTWVRYQSGFISLSAGVINLVCASIANEIVFIQIYQINICVSVFLILLIVLGFRKYVLSKYGFEDEPFRVFIKSLI